MSVQGPNRIFDQAAAAFVTTVTSPPPVGGPSGYPAATAKVSPWAELLSKLQTLKQDSPASFQKVVAGLADTVRSRAQSATGDAKQELGKLADKLTQAGKTGDLSVFKPTKHAHHHSVAPRSAMATESLMQALLDQVDHVLGPGASSPLSTQG